MKEHPWYVVAFFIAGLIWFSVNGLATGIGIVQQQLISLSQANQQAQQLQQRLQEKDKELAIERAKAPAKPAEEKK
jgi:preprotein translocase subunit SecF